MKEFNLTYYSEAYLVSQDANGDYYYYSISYDSGVPIKSETDYRFAVTNAYGIAYKFTSPNYYLKPQRVTLYATGNKYLSETKIQGDIVASSYDVTAKDTGTVVFSQSSSTNSRHQVILKGALTTINLSQSLTELVALLPILLPCVVCLLSIRKGVRFTLQMLRTA